MDNETRAGVAVDPMGCRECVAAREICRFHAGWAAGWDDAVEVMATWADAAPGVELLDELPETSHVVA